LGYEKNIEDFLKKKLYPNGKKAEKKNTPPMTLRRKNKV